MGERERERDTEPFTLEGLSKFVGVRQSNCKYIYIETKNHQAFFWNSNRIAIEQFSQLLDWGEGES